jgi:outer membrane immunogenic protein
MRRFMIFRSIAVPLLLLAISNAALADDVLPPDAAVAAPIDWSGLYVGAHGGAGRSSTNWGFPFTQYYNFGLPPGQSFSTDPDGGLYGGHVLLNLQRGPIVAGLEVSFSGADLTHERIGAVASIYPADRFDTGIDNLTTISARLGFAISNVLLYAKGGYATADVTHAALSGPPGAGVAIDKEAAQNGRIVGGGIEYMLGTRVVLGLEYNFIKLDDERQQTTTTGTQPGLPITIDSDDIALHAVMARVSLRLGAEPQVAEPLK